VEEMRMHRDHFTVEWTMRMEADFLNPRTARHAASNKQTWDGLTTSMKNLIRMTYRTALTHPISNSEEQANHFGSHLKSWMQTRREFDISSEEYWRITNLLAQEGPGWIHTRPCKWHLEDANCRMGEDCKHLHVFPKRSTAGAHYQQTKFRRER
jgi:hypothetical protein